MYAALIQNVHENIMKHQNGVKKTLKTPGKKIKKRGFAMNCNYFQRCVCRLFVAVMGHILKALFGLKIFWVSILSMPGISKGHGHWIVHQLQLLGHLHTEHFIVTDPRDGRHIWFNRGLVALLLISVSFQTSVVFQDFLVAYLDWWVYIFMMENLYRRMDFFKVITSLPG